MKCKGCISTDTWSKATQKINIDLLLDQIHDWLLIADGITISGGEPFEQPQALSYLVECLKKITQVDILVYSGFAVETISNLLIAMHPYIDVLISDPYERNSTNSLSLRGSDNQRIHFLTELGKKRFAYAEYKNINSQDNLLDIMFDDKGEIWFAGIPRRDDFIKLCECYNLH